MNRLAFLRGVAAVLAAPLALRSLAAEEPLHPLARPYPSDLRREVGVEMSKALRSVRWTGHKHTKITALVAVKDALESRWPEHGFSYQAISETHKPEQLTVAVSVVPGREPGYPAVTVSRSIVGQHRASTVFVSPGVYVREEDRHIWKGAGWKGLRSHANPELT